MEKKLLLVAALAWGLSACDGGTKEPELTRALHPINDTGTAHCRDVASGEVDCAVAMTQDGNTGRDFNLPTKKGAGPYGFDWTKLDSGGDPLQVQDLSLIHISEPTRRS